MRKLVAVIALCALLAGCLSTPEETGSAEGDRHDGQPGSATSQGNDGNRSGQPPDDHQRTDNGRHPENRSKNETEPGADDDSDFVWNETGLLYPGAHYLHQNGRCTLGFILTEPGNESVFAMTAGHCVELGEQLTISETDIVFGEVVAIGPEHGAANDWAIIRIYNESRHLVNPMMAHWSGPTSPIKSSELANTLCFYGNGVGFYPIGSNNPVGEDGARCGNLYSEDEDTIQMSWPGGDHGDSGSPLIHHGSGGAYGIVIRSNYSLISVKVCSILSSYEESNGASLSVATAAYEKQEPRPVPVSRGNVDHVEPC